MKRALALLVLFATAASSSDLELATRHTELRALALACELEPKRQWAPSGNFQALQRISRSREESDEQYSPGDRQRAYRNGLKEPTFGLFDRSMALWHVDMKELRTLAVAVGDALAFFQTSQLADFPLPTGSSFEDLAGRTTRELAELTSRTRKGWKRQLLELVQRELRNLST